MRIQTSHKKTFQVVNTEETGQVRREIEQAMQELERQGLLVRTGEYRRNREGILEPVFVAREVYNQIKAGSRMSCRTTMRSTRPLK
jgi:hypothetical protein